MGSRRLATRKAAIQSSPPVTRGRSGPADDTCIVLLEPFNTYSPPKNMYVSHTKPAHSHSYGTPLRQKLLVAFGACRVAILRLSLHLDKYCAWIISFSYDGTPLSLGELKRRVLRRPRVHHFRRKRPSARLWAARLRVWCCHMHDQGGCYNLYDDLGGTSQMEPTFAHAAPFVTAHIQTHAYHSLSLSARSPLLVCPLSQLPPRTTAPIYTLQ